jgi:hypothetical protein
MTDTTSLQVESPSVEAAPVPAKEDPILPPRVEALREAARLINSERNVHYGPPSDNFDRIARLWSVVLGIDVSMEDVSMCMVALKMARYASKSGWQPDTWIDIAGYAGCGYEVGLLNSENTDT